MIPAAAKEWGAQRTPAPGSPRAIGGFSSGCLQGAATLPPSGPGYEVLHLSRNRNYGHPALVDFVRRLGKKARRAKLGLVVVGDLAQPRGGPTPSGHKSHQTGLDVDVGYAAPPGVRAGHLSAADRERLSPPVAIELTTHKTTAIWGPHAVALVGMAAADPAVDRVFVNPGLKRLLCEGPTRKAPWQGRVRPWWAHHDHFHVRLKCPADSPACTPQEPQPGDGCGAGLDWWFTGDATATRARRKQGGERTGPRVPAGCAALLVPATAVARRDDKPRPAAGALVAGAPAGAPTEGTE
jgi:penicillin-insensitive murein endopeptidase